MSKLSQFRALPTLSADGVWFDFEAWDLQALAAPSKESICLRIARMRGPKWRNRRAELIDQRRDELRAGGVALARGLEQITTQCLAEVILLDWANLENDDGATIPYTVEKAVEILQDPANDPLRQFVIEAASQRDAFAREAEDHALGNS